MSGTGAPQAGASPRPPCYAIDPEARKDAALAHARLDGHLTHCSERYKEQKDAIAEVKSMIGDVRLTAEQGHKRIVRWVVAIEGSVIVAMVGAGVAYFFR